MIYIIHHLMFYRLVLHKYSFSYLKIQRKPGLLLPSTSLTIRYKKEFHVEMYLKVRWCRAFFSHEFIKLKYILSWKWPIIAAFWDNWLSCKEMLLHTKLTQAGKYLQPRRKIWNLFKRSLKCKLFLWITGKLNSSELVRNAWAQDHTLCLT